MLRRTMLSCLLAAALCGCVTVTLRPGDVLVTNDEVARQGLTLSGKPARQARLDADRRVTDANLPAGFGDLHTVTVEGRPKAPLIVFCGGNAFREAYAGAARAEALARFGDVLLFDYPGSGQTDGRGDRAEFDSASAALTGEIERRAQGGRAVVFWGHSLGGGFCSDLAARTKVKSALVLEGAFARYDDVADAKAGLLAPLVRIRLDDEALRYDIPALLTGYEAPIVVVASRADETIPFSASRRLASRLQASGKPVRFIELRQARHSTLFTDPQYDSRLRAALDSIGVAEPAGQGGDHPRRSSTVGASR